jgi:hypothetical protein
MNLGVAVAEVSVCGRTTAVVEEDAGVEAAEGEEIGIERHRRWWRRPA